MDSATRGVAEDGYVVDCFVEHLKWLGYSHVILKSYNENAILKLPMRSINLRIIVRDVVPGMRIVLQDEQPTPYDRASNGLAESAWQRCR